jgi:methylthioribose-1-phosphate isomerase
MITARGPLVEWQNNHIITLDQRLLPGEVRELSLTPVDAPVEAIKGLAIRRAPNTASISRVDLRASYASAIATPPMTCMSATTPRRNRRSPSRRKASWMAARSRQWIGPAHATSNS